MYGGSGMWPMRSIAAATVLALVGPEPDGPPAVEVPREHLAVDPRRRRARTRPARPASASARDASAPPRTQNAHPDSRLPGRTSALLLLWKLDVGSSESSTADTRRHRRSARDGRAAAPETRACCSPRADRRHAGSRARSPNIASSEFAALTIEDKQPRSAALGGGSCAISSSGRSKSKSATFM